jgi:hypothetical protein
MLNSLRFKMNIEYNDKNSLRWIKNIGEMPLYVKGKGSTTYALLGLGYGVRAREACQGQGGISLQQWNILGVGSSCEAGLKRGALR